MRFKGGAPAFQDEASGEEAEPQSRDGDLARRNLGFRTEQPDYAVRVLNRLENFLLYSSFQWVTKQSI